MATDLRAHLDALIDGTSQRVANCPSDECLEISQAIADCVHATVRSADALAAPSRLLPPLP